MWAIRLPGASIQPSLTWATTILSSYTAHSYHKSTASQSPTIHHAHQLTLLSVTCSSPSTTDSLLSSVRATVMT